MGQWISGFRVTSEVRVLTGWAQLAGQQPVPPQPRNRLVSLWLSEQMLEAFVTQSTSECSSWVRGHPGSSVTGCFLTVVTSEPALVAHVGPPTGTFFSPSWFHEAQRCSGGSASSPWQREGSSRGRRLEVEAPQGIVVPMLTALHRCCQETRWHPAATAERSRSGRFSLVLCNKSK